jgi:NADH-quinone oxidoreductase subunit E
MRPTATREVARFQHGSRVPGWDEAADLTKDPAHVPDPATTPVPADLRAEIEGHMANYPDRRSASIPALAAAQRVHGWCSPEAIEQVACVMRLTPGYLLSVASFYDMLETEPVGRHSVYVCTNISCSLLGADELLARVKAEAGDDPEFNVRAFECLGACDIAPMASVDGVYVGPVELDEVPELIGQIREGSPPLPEKQLLRRLSADPSVNAEDFARPDVRRRAVAGAAMPSRPAAEGALAAVPPVTEKSDEPGPSAALENPPSAPEGPSQSEDGAAG